MPEICRISELSIQMIFKDQTDKLKKIRQWLQNHQDELSVNWQRAKNAEKLERIDT